jgi:hypothetical protein
MVQQLEWGISPEREVGIAWGARAIYKGGSDIDLVWDRMGMQGGTEEQRKAFGKFLDKKGLPALKKLLKSQYLSTRDDKSVHLQLDGWFITANPRGSCGYLYIGAWPVDNGIPNYIPAEVKPTRKVKS